MADRFRAAIAPEAAAAIARITSWWHEHRPSAPGLFQLELEQALLKIVEYPEIGARARLKSASDVRYVVLRRTGYIVLYSVDFDGLEIAVLRVRHGKRRPLTRLRRT